MQKLFNRRFFALKSTEAITNVTNTCSHCLSLKSIPRELHDQCGSSTPDTPFTTFACDILRRHKQYIFVFREYLISYTITSLLLDDSTNSLRLAIVKAVSSLRPTPQSSVVIRTDNASGFQAF